MIGREAFGKMKDGVILVNVSRGKVVKEEELVGALESGKGGFSVFHFSLWVSHLAFLALLPLLMA